MVKDRLYELHNQRGSDEQPVQGTTLRPKNDGGLSTQDIEFKLNDLMTDRTSKELNVFLVKCESCSRKLHNLWARTNDLTSVHNDIISGVNLNDATLSEKRRAATESIRQLTYEIRDEISALKQDVLIMPNEGTYARMSALHLQKLTSDLHDATLACQTERARFGDKVKSRLRREYEVMGEQKTDSELNELIENENYSSFTQVMVEMNAARTMLDETKRRELEIRTLEKSVAEVHELFVDINELVKVQGETLTTIEGNVNAAVGSVEGGQKQLKKAVELQSKVRRKKIIIAAIVIIVILVIVAIILATTLPSSE